MTRHEALLERYAEELTEAKRAAEEWWSALLARETAATGSGRKAREGLRKRWPDGPASHPWVIHVIRKYWFACEALNEAIRAAETDANERESEEYVIDTSEDADEEPEDYAGEEEIYPHVFILECLLDGLHDSLATFIGNLSYWPIGLDEEERYT